MRMIKIKQLFCKHKFKYYVIKKGMYSWDYTWERVCKCEKCGKEKKGMVGMIFY